MADYAFGSNPPYELDELIADRDDLSSRIKIVADCAPAFQTDLN